MDKINLWCKLVSTVSVVSSAFLLLIPEGRLKKSFNTLVAVILIFSVFMPLNEKENIDLLSIFNDSSEAKAELENEIEIYVDSSLVLCAQNETEKFIRNIMVNLNVTAECKVKCEYIHDKLLIKRIEVTGDINANNISDLYDEIKKICTDDTEVIFNGEKYG